MEHFNQIWPDETCGPSYSTAMLENTYWKLVRLGNEWVNLGAGDKEPYIMLITQGNRVQGFAGCNRLMGSYELKGENLKFVRMQALESTMKWKIKGERLELNDLNGALVARFELRYLRAGSAAGSSKK